MAHLLGKRKPRIPTRLPILGLHQPLLEEPKHRPIRRMGINILVSYILLPPPPKPLFICWHYCSIKSYKILFAQCMFDYNTRRNKGLGIIKCVFM